MSTISCNFIGHLEKESTACVAVTGCYGIGNVEFTIKSSHLSSSNYFIMDKNGNIKELEDEEEVQNDSIEIENNTFSSRKASKGSRKMITFKPKGMPYKQLLTLKVLYIKHRL